MMFRRLRSIAARTTACVLVMMLATSCGTVIDTVSTQDASGKLCETNGGVYFLPKKHITAQIIQADSGDKYYKLALGEQPVAVADRRQHYCLDYLASAAAEDIIQIGRTPNGLLQNISTTTEDKSLAIAEKIIDIGLIAVTGDPTFSMRSFRTDAGDKLIADFNFDPFDEPRLAEINETLITYGYCIYVGQHTPDPKRMCSNPGRYATAYAPVDAAYSPVIPFEEGQRGILYRPDMTYQIVVMRRRDPGSRENWKIYQVKHVELPNIAPVLSVPVDRSFFVKRQTTLDFKDGVLQDVTIKKPSELLAFSELPLRLAQAIVSVPATVIKVRIASTDNRARLIDAQTKLIATKKAYADQVARLQEKQDQYGNPSRNVRFTTRNLTLPADTFDTFCGQFDNGNPSCVERSRSIAANACRDTSDIGEFDACLKREYRRIGG